ncbi:MAG TPA: S41 family peptidase [Stellaceae bacterium]|nr:S41 family peptidase [Stellaceae bacterium]
MKLASRLRPAAIGAAAALLTVMPLFACQDASSRRDPPANDGDLALIQDVLQRVKQSYVEPVNTDKFVTNALKGALTGLDPHSDYMDEKEYRQMQSDTRGEFGGLGMELTMADGVPKVVSPIDDTPAARAGIRAGDLILKITGQPTDNMNLAEVVERLRGPAGTSIELTIVRNGRSPFDITLTRAVIHVVSVKSKLEPNRIGYARISTFTEQTQDELTDAIGRMQREAGGHLAGLVLDLRNDPGGLLDAAVDVAGDFLDGGTIVSTRGRESEDDEVYTAPADGDRIRGTPMVVLINGASASASEIVAGALQDDHRATVMGTGSFGKGSVQTIIPLHGRGALRLTTARYYTPSGRSIQDHGILPDIVVGLPKSERLAKGIVVHEADLRGALKNTGALNAIRGTASPEGAAAETGAGGAAGDAPIDPAIIGTSKDSQLAAALKFLEGKMASAARPRG